MSKEVLELVIGMDMKKLETQLAIQCAPLITGLKISNLLIVAPDNDKLLQIEMRNSGLMFYRLISTTCKNTYLLFHRPSLEKHLEDEEVQKFLVELGYSDFRLGSVLRRFQERYQLFIRENKEFPHEMGVLLGYPMEDVKGFIENEGENFLYSGYWKVYDRVEEKKALFEAYENSQKDLVRILALGFSLKEIMSFYQACSAKNRLAV